MEQDVRTLSDHVRDYLFLLCRGPYRDYTHRQ